MKKIRILFSLLMSFIVGFIMANFIGCNPIIPSMILFAMSFVKVRGYSFASLITCPTDCSSPLPPVEANYCNPDVTNAQITTLYLESLNADPFSDITDITEWNSRLSQTGVNINDIRTLHVIGEKTAAESNTVDLGADKSVTVQKTHKLTLIVRETGTYNYDLLRSSECGGNYKIAYALGKYLFVNSDATGNIDNDLIEANVVINDKATNNFNDAYEFEITVTWKAKFHPGRILNPMA